MRTPVEKSPLQIAYGAIAAVQAATIVQLSAGTVFDWPLRVTVGSFAISIPLLSLLVTLLILSPTRRRN